MVRRISVLLAAVLILSGCGEQRLFAVKAVAAGIPSLAPFFEEDGSLGRDRKDVKPEQPHSGLQQGNTPGLYGGTRDQRVCDVERLKDFLTDPGNRQKAREWARIVGITPDRIEEYLDDLTPVLLRHDTLVRNHDYKKGRAVPYDSLLEAGVAVLVNDQGLPAVKCSCGNPLKAFDKDPRKISVEFEDGNDEWAGYDKTDVVTVRPSPQRLERIALLDVDDPDTGISRPVGSTGDADDTFDTTEEQDVPAVVGDTFAEASTELAARGLAVAYPDELPPAGARVTASDPAAGTPLRFGAAVALSLAGDDDPEPPPDPSSSGTGSPATGGPSSTGPSTGGTDSGGPGGTGPSGEPPTSKPPTSEPRTDKPSTGGPGTSVPPTDRPSTGGPTTGGTAAEPTTADPPAPTVPSTPPTAGPTSAGSTSTTPTPSGPTPADPTLSGSVPSGPVPPDGPDTGGSDRSPV